MTIGELVDTWESYEDEEIKLYLSSFYGMDIQKYQDKYRDLKVDRFTVNGDYELVIYVKLPTPQKIKLLYDPNYDPNVRIKFGDSEIGMWDVVGNRQVMNMHRIVQRVKRVNKEG